MISSGAIKPKRQPVLSKSAQDRKDQLYRTLRKHPVLDPIIDIVTGYDQAVFVPYWIYKFKDENKFIIITKPRSDEVNPVDVAKRVAIYYVTPDSIQSLAVKDVNTVKPDSITKRVGIYSFVAGPGEVKVIDLENNTVIIDHAPYDQKFLLEESKLENLKSVVSQRVFDHLSFLSSPQQESRDMRLSYLVLQDDAACIQRLISEGKINPNSVDEEGVPMLVIAAKHGRHKALQALVQGGADLESRSNASDFHGTALLYAARRRKHDMIQFLVESGADVNAQDAEGMTSLAYMSYYGDASFVDFLIKHDANPCLTNLADSRPVDLWALYVASTRILSEYHMSRDAEQRVEHWFYDEKSACYNIRFKNNMSTNDTLRAWDAIANKIKSQLVSADVGLLKNITRDISGRMCTSTITLKCYPYVQVNIQDNGPDAVNSKVNYNGEARISHMSDIKIPDAKHYAIQKMDADQQGITITLKDEYKNDLLVAKKLREIFAELKIKPAPVADAKVSDNPAAMFAPPVLTVNHKPVDAVKQLVFY